MEVACLEVNCWGLWALITAIILFLSGIVLGIACCGKWDTAPAPPRFIVKDADAHLHIDVENRLRSHSLGRSTARSPRAGGDVVVPHVAPASRAVSLAGSHISCGGACRAAEVSSASLRGACVDGGDGGATTGGVHRGHTPRLQRDVEFEFETGGRAGTASEDVTPHDRPRWSLRRLFEKRGRGGVSPPRSRRLVASQKRGSICRPAAGAMKPGCETHAQAQPVTAYGAAATVPRAVSPPTSPLWVGQAHHIAMSPDQPTVLILRNQYGAPQTLVLPPPQLDGGVGDGGPPSFANHLPPRPRQASPRGLPKVTSPMGVRVKRPSGALHRSAHDRLG